MQCSEGLTVTDKICSAIEFDNVIKSKQMICVRLRKWLASLGIELRSTARSSFPWDFAPAALRLSSVISSYMADEPVNH